MNCSGFEKRLEDLLDGTADEGRRRAAEEHLSSCPRCRELDTLVRGAVPVEAEAPVDLTASILERTSGAACHRAENLLGEAADGPLGRVDAELLELHRSHCARCAALALALERLREDLPTLGTADPGPRFTDQVLARTLSFEQRLRRLRRRLADGWRRMAARPRIAWEVSYVGALVLFLVFGTPASPLHGMPEQALALAQVNPLHVLRDSPLGRVPGVVASWGEGAWSVSGARVVRSSEEMGVELRARLVRAGGATRAFVRHGTELGEAVLQGNLEEGLSVLKSMGVELVTFWKHVIVGDDDAGDNGAAGSQPNAPATESETELA